MLEQVRWTLVWFPGWNLCSLWCGVVVPCWRDAGRETLAGWETRKYQNIFRPRMFYVKLNWPSTTSTTVNTSAFTGGLALCQSVRLIILEWKTTNILKLLAGGWVGGGLEVNKQPIKTISYRLTLVWSGLVYHCVSSPFLPLIVGTVGASGESWLLTPFLPAKIGCIFSLQHFLSEPATNRRQLAVKCSVLSSMQNFGKLSLFNW